jgi:hypothetical protein
MYQAQAQPKYLICDQGKQFWCRGFKDWCDRKGIRPRFGAVGQQGSIAVVERFVQTVKIECTRRLVVSLRAKTFRQELSWFAIWYNQHRPHTTLRGRTPDEVYCQQRPANRIPRFEALCRGLLPLFLWVVNPLLPVRRAMQRECRAGFPGSPMTRNSTPNFAGPAQPLCNLYNKEGLPASPFRTDDWPLESSPAE